MDTVRRLKRLVKIALGRIPVMRVERQLPTRFYGTDYGGWDVYVEPIGPDSIIYDFGIGQDASFPAELIRNHGCTVHGFDPTPGLSAWVESQSFPPEFVFHPVGLAWFDGEAEIRSQSPTAQTSGTILGHDEFTVPTRGTTIPVKRLPTLMDELGHTHLDLLKMDIEGAEFGVIEDLAKTNIRPKQLLVETHRYIEEGLRKERETFANLREMGYLLYKVSKRDMEYSYIHRDAL